MDKERRYHPDYATFEHLQPVSLGGSNRVENFVLACRACNEARGNGATEQRASGSPVMSFTA